MRLLVPLALLALVPGAAATTATFGFSPTFQQLSVQGEAQLDGAFARQVRNLMDSVGNRDGNVTQDEADRFVRDFAGVVKEWVQQRLGGGDLTLDNEPFVSSDLVRLAIHGAPGPVDSPAPLQADVELSFLFNATGHGTHAFRAVAAEVPGGRLDVVVEAPDGWTIQSLENLDGATLAEDRGSVRFQSPPAGEAFGIVFAGGAEASPDAGAWLAATALAAVAALRRRGA